MTRSARGRFWVSLAAWVALSLVFASVARGQADPNNPRVTPVVLAYRRAKPAIVNISATRVARVRGLFNNPFFDDVFPSRPRRTTNLGSGVIIHPGGFVVTNAHVIQQARRIVVTTAEDVRYEARAIASDRACDLAILKLDPNDPLPGEDGRRPPASNTLPHLPLGRSDDLMVGETVIAVGNPLGLSNTLTMGIISATDRTLRFGDESVFEGLIQTDAPINPGNSGGPLLNIKGEFIGINTAIRADAQNIGFAIPVDRLGDELVDLLDVERMKRVVFGARIVRPRRDRGGGLLVQQVRLETPAAEGLQAGDRVVAIDGEPVEQLTDYVFAMLSAEAGRTLRFTVRREGVRRTVEVTLARRPKPDGRKLAQRLLGLTLREITPELAREWSLPARSGLVVVGVDRGGPGDRIGVELKDVVFQVGRIHVGDLDELGAVLEDVRPGEALRVGVARRNIVAWATLRTAGEE